jgi:ribonuclease-3
MADAKSFQTHINYQFHNCSLLEEAFLSAGASVSDTKVEGPKKGNKRLALVGDAALRLAVIDEWFRENSDPGKLYVWHISGVFRTNSFQRLARVVS